MKKVLMIGGRNNIGEFSTKGLMTEKNYSINN